MVAVHTNMHQTSLRSFAPAVFFNVWAHYYFYYVINLDTASQLSRLVDTLYSTSANFYHISSATVLQHQWTNELEEKDLCYFMYILSFKDLCLFLIFTDEWDMVGGCSVCQGHYSSTVDLGTARDSVHRETTLQFFVRCHHFSLFFSFLLLMSPKRPQIFVATPQTLSTAHPQHPASLREPRASHICSPSIIAPCPPARLRSLEKQPVGRGCICNQTEREQCEISGRGCFSPHTPTHPYSRGQGIRR